MFSFFSWNAQAQIPPRGSSIQKCRFAFGEWLAFRAVMHVLLVVCAGCPPALGCLLQAPCWAGDKGSCTACAGALGKQHRAQGSCCCWLSWHHHSAALGWGVPPLYPCCSVMGSPSVRLLLSPAQDRLVPPAVCPAAALHSSCLEFRNLLQLRNVFFCIALTAFANDC